MSTITFDTDRLVEDLKASGIEHNQARAIVRGIVEAQSELATKRDIEDLRMATKQDMIQLEQRLTIKLGSMMVVAISIVAVLVKLL